MEFNTIPFVNPNEEVFIARFDGENYELKPGEKRYFPSYLSKGFAEQLIDKKLSEALVKDKNLDKDAFRKGMLNQVLGEEMMTATPERAKTTREKVSEHEEIIKEMLIEEEKKKKAQKIEALKIVREANPLE